MDLNNLKKPTTEESISWALKAGKKLSTAYSDAVQEVKGKTPEEKIDNLIARFEQLRPYKEQLLSYLEKPEDFAFLEACIADINSNSRHRVNAVVNAANIFLFVTPSVLGMIAFPELAKYIAATTIPLAGYAEWNIRRAKRALMDGPEPPPKEMSRFWRIFYDKDRPYNEWVDRRKDPFKSMVAREKIFGIAYIAQAAFNVISHPGSVMSVAIAAGNAWQGHKSLGVRATAGELMNDINELKRN
jgi:hypothetical protein